MPLDDADDVDDDPLAGLSHHVLPSPPCRSHLPLCQVRPIFRCNSVSLRIPHIIHFVCAILRPVISAKQMFSQQNKLRSLNTNSHAVFGIWPGVFVI